MGVIIFLKAATVHDLAVVKQLFVGRRVLSGILLFTDGIWVIEMIMTVFFGPFIARLASPT